MIDGVRVSKGSLVRVHPSRRADAQDLFFADQDARVTAVLSDVDGSVHVAVVLVEIRRPTCTTGTAAISTSLPRSWSRCTEEVSPNSRKESTS